MKIIQHHPTRRQSALWFDATKNTTFSPDEMITYADGSSEKHELWKVQRIDRVFEDHDRPMYPNPLSLKPNTPLAWFVDDDDAVAAKVNVEISDINLDKGVKAEAFTLAGPRLDIAFDPQQCKAAVVTCGGICPGESSCCRWIQSLQWKKYGC